MAAGLVFILQFGIMFMVLSTNVFASSARLVDWDFHTAYGRPSLRFLVVLLRHSNLLSSPSECFHCRYHNCRFP